MRPFRFGVQASRVATAEEWVRTAREADDLGYDVLTVADHLTDQLAPLPALAAAAAATTRRRTSGRSTSGARPSSSRPWR